MLLAFLILVQKHFLCPTSDVKLATSVCEGQEYHNDGGICSSSALTGDCIGGGVTTYTHITTWYCSVRRHAVYHVV
jgi:hypothetical protein